MKINATKKFRNFSLITSWLKYSQLTNMKQKAKKKEIEEKGKKRKISLAFNENQRSLRLLDYHTFHHYSHIASASKRA